MSSIHQPDKPPIRPQPAPGKSGSSMCIGAIFFLVILFGSMILAAYILPPFVANLELPELSLSLTIYLPIIMIVVVVISIGILGKGGNLLNGMGVRYRDRDPSMCSRVIKDGYDGQEFIIVGNKDETFAQACKANWQFQNVSQKSRWYIKDEKGNDVTEMTLGNSDGTFILVPEYVSEIPQEEPDESDEYSSIHDSVTYYD